MKGLLFKEFKRYKNFMIASILLIFILGFLSIIIKNPTGTTPVYIFIYALMYFIPSFFDDSKFGWERLQATLPVDEKKIVIVKYVVLLILVAFLYILFIVVSVLFDKQIDMNYIIRALISSIWAMFIGSIILPITFKYDYSAAKVTTIAILGIIAVFIAILSGSIGGLTQIFINLGILKTFMFVIIISFLMTYISYRQSIKFFRLKDIS